MKKVIDLGIARNYVSSWGYKEGIREIVQNCIDEGIYDIKYDEDSETLEMITFGKKIGLDKLALGNSTKRDDNSKIGQYGEGLKLAFLVLLREGMEIKLENGDYEEWIISIEPSKNLGKIDTLHVTINKQPIPKGMEDGEFVKITVTNLSEDLLEELCEENLIIRKEILGDDLDTIETDYGYIIKDKNFEGKIYVNGLYVTEDMNVKFGFDFFTGQISLDRDRKSINYHELLKKVSETIVNTEDSALIYQCYKDSAFSDRILENIKDSSEEVKNDFKENYFKDKTKIENCLLLSRSQKDFIELTNFLSKNNINVPIRIEDNEDVRKIINESNDFQDYVDLIDEKYEEWKKIRKTFPEQLEQFNKSNYKKLLVVYGKMKNCDCFSKEDFNVITYILKYNLVYHAFQSVLQYIDFSTVTEKDVKIKDLKLSEEQLKLIRIKEEE